MDKTLALPWTQACESGVARGDCNDMPTRRSGRHVHEERRGEADERLTANRSRCRDQRLECADEKQEACSGLSTTTRMQRLRRWQKGVREGGWDGRLRPQHHRTWAMRMSETQFSFRPLSSNGVPAWGMLSCPCDAYALHGRCIRSVWTLEMLEVVLRLGEEVEGDP